MTHPLLCRHLTAPMCTYSRRRKERRISLTNTTLSVKCESWMWLTTFSSVIVIQATRYHFVHNQLNMIHFIYNLLCIHRSYIVNSNVVCVCALSVTNLASAPNQRFSATLPHACVILPTHPFHPTHNRCGNLSAVLQTYAQPLCLLFSLLRHSSADLPLLRMRGWFLWDNAAIPPTFRVKVHNCASFVDISRSV